MGPTPSTIPVLTQVGLPDNSRYNFEYNSYGQVATIRYYAADNHQRRYTTYAYTGGSTDCPRVSEEHDWAENWNGLNGVPAEAVTYFSHDGGACVMTAPDGTIYKETYGSGWQSGLTTGSEIWSGGVEKKWTSTAWTQENPNVNYLLNPRVIQTDINDSENNHKKTVIDYSNSTYAAYSLPYGVMEYGADGASLIRSTWFDYNLGQQYLDKRIIGLVMWEHVFDHVAGWYAAKTTYEYDEGQINPQAVNAANHDPSYSTSVGRGNVTSVSRWDVTDISNPSKAHSNHVTYDAAGSVLSSSDALSHPSSIDYSPSYAYAYPTTATDADGYSSSVQYNFDTGAVTHTQGPPTQGSQGLTPGAIQDMAYDSVGRLQWITRPDGFWRYIAYADRGDAVMSQVSIAEYPTSAWSIAVVDGAGRTRLVGGDNPGSNGGYAGAFTLYDVMGRANQQSHVEETNAWWAPVGDDLAGWIWTSQTYDWKGRPLVTTHTTDGTTKYAEYGGCGCAGGEVVTVHDEMGRQQRITSDSLGRAFKTEVLNSDTSVYSTRILTYNGRDQVTSVKQYQGPQSSGVYQEELSTYDGYGRLATHKAPIQTSAITYSYYDNDKPLTVTDARGATTTLIYNNRGLATNISYSGPAPVPSPVTLSYDAAGNRASMSDGSGSVSYGYNSLSQLTSETRQFTGLSGSFALSYEYNLGGELKSITDPVGSRVDYSFDSTGRLLSASGSGPASTPTYASNFSYRAFGGVKDFDFGNSMHQHLNFNSRLQNTSLTLGTMSWSYDYYADGKLSKVTDSNDPRFDRSFSFDQVGRISEAKTGSEARGGTTADGPFKQPYNYDVWENATGRTYRVWAQGTQSESPSYTNNRHQYWGYDNQGQLTGDDNGNYGYDAASQQNYFASYQTVGGWPSNNPQQPALEVAQTFDGNSTPASKTTTNRWEVDFGNGPEVQQSVATTYYLRSTALGGKVVAELDNTGYKRTGYIYAGGMQIAQQHIWNPGYGFYIHWLSTSPATGSEYTMVSGGYVGRKELDPLGADVTNPPDPTIASEPVFYNPRFSNMPIEYEWGPSDEYLAGMSWWEGQLDAAVNYEANVQLTAYVADLWQSDRSAAEAILEHNPNIGVQTADGTTRWGQEAADFLHGLGANVEVVNHFGESSSSERHFAHAPQNSVADRRCPPTVDQIIANKKIRAELNVAFSVSGHRTDHPLEHGGWIYQTRRGALQFVRAGDERAASGSIDLRNPPTFRGAIVVADYHTHPYTESNATNSLREGFNNMRPSQQDEDVAFKVGVPDIVVYESGFQNGASQLTAWGVGPNRRGGAPDRAGAPGDGFPGNSVDNRGCR